MRTLVWFRSDLRVADNAALSHAARHSTNGIVALFLISPSEWKAHDLAPVRVDFMLRSLAELSRELVRLTIPLLIRHAKRAGDVPALVLDAAKFARCDAIAFNREYEVNERARDDATLARFARERITATAATDQSLFEPGVLRTGEGRWYTVFTPFAKAARARLAIDHPESLCPPVHGAPKRQPDTGIPPDPVPTAAEGFNLTEATLDAVQVRETPAVLRSVPAGEQAAMKRLAAFTRERITDYKDARDLPALDGTSILSPHLAIGTISPRQCLAAAVDALREHSKKDRPALDDSKLPGISQWITELLWREFYIHVMVGFPRVSMNRAFKLSTERLRWSTNDDHFRAWCEGRTGVPIVDAGMRQLRTVGWMHNRVRMITAMFLTKNLLIDWRRGERFFMNHLVDGFLASNNGGWQWSASTGTDAAPYFRIFNPVSQSQKCDPDGASIRRWVPELRTLSAEAIHEPWEGGVVTAQLDYPPRPIVDLSKSRQAAIDAFRALADA